MEYIVYAISSQARNYIYVGMTTNLLQRVKQHNLGYEHTTKAYCPFLVIYTEICADRIQAREREKYWKSGVGKEKLRLIRESFL